MIAKAPATCIVHHWMEYFRGGEAVLEELSALFPAAPIRIMVYNHANLSRTLQERTFRPSLLQHLPGAKSHFRKLLPFFPELVRTMRVPKRTRFVFSSDASVIKGVSMPEDAIHVCYCHSPPRYIWGLEEAYLQSASQGGRFARGVFRAALPRLRRFDQRSAYRVDRFIANSRCVQERILRCYGKPSVVINPPVNVHRFDHQRPREDFFLIVSALVPYKRVDLAVDACSRLGLPLVVIGTGPEEEALQRRASPQVKFLGWQSQSVVKDHFERCRGFLFPGIEDFGITPCEAQAAGAPVIAFGEGGALETVKPGVTGMFFAEQTVASLAEALEHFVSLPDFSAEVCRANVEHLSPRRFRHQIRDCLEREFPILFAEHLWPREEVPQEAPAPVFGLPVAAT